MRDISEKRAVELRWPEVGGIVAKEIKEVLGLQVQCRVRPHRRTGKMLCLMRVAQMSAALESCWLRN